MSKSERETLANLVNDYHREQGPANEKNIREFATSRERHERINRARQNEEDFHHRFGNRNNSDDKEDFVVPIITVADQPLENTEASEKDEVEPTKAIFSASSISDQKPDFVGATIPASTIPLQSLEEIPSEEPSEIEMNEDKAEPIFPEEEGGTMQFDPNQSHSSFSSPNSTSYGGTNGEQSDGLKVPSFTSNKVAPSNNQPTAATVEMTRPLGPNQNPISSVSPSGPTMGATMDLNMVNTIPGGPGSTRSFGGPNMTSNRSGTIPISGTREVNQGELQSLTNANSSKESFLRKEYVSSNLNRETSYEEKRPHTKSNKLYLTIGAIIGVIVFLIVGGVVVKNYLDNAFHTTQNASAYEELLAWATDFPTFDEKKQKNITQWRVTYEKCTEEQKKKIDEALVTGTGKTFDELLAAVATNQSKETSISNENVAKAEKKAKLKDEIATLKAEISNLQSQLNTINNAENTYNSKNAAYVAAQNKVQACQNTLDTLNMQLNSLPDDTYLQNQLATLKTQLSLTSPTILPAQDSDTSFTPSDDTPTSPPIAVPGTPNGISSSTQNNPTTSSTTPADTNQGISNPSSGASGIVIHNDDVTSEQGKTTLILETSPVTPIPNPEYEALKEQIAEIEAEIQSSSSERFSLQVQISDAEAALAEAQAAVPEAKSEADAAYGAWQALKNEGASIQKQIDEKNAKLIELQDELDALQ